jgi:hypothetical protein
VPTDLSQSLAAGLAEALTESRQAHSAEVGRKTARAARLVPVRMRQDLVVAGHLHDVGYGHAVSGFHPLDGAELLEARGFSSLVCHLVAHHSASPIEAQFRGIDLDTYRRYTVEDAEIQAAERVMTWADMTTGPDGSTVTLEERIAEATERYGPDHVVTAALREAEPVLREACYWVAGSMNGSV